MVSRGWPESGTLMPWQDLMYAGLFLVIWYVLVTKVLPRFGVGT